jgi:hypothetical protein
MDGRAMTTDMNDLTNFALMALGLLDRGPVWGD